MNEQVTRQILWNIPVAFIVLMYSLLGLLIAGFIYAGVRWYRLVSLGVSDDRLDHPIERERTRGLRPAIGGANSRRRRAEGKGLSAVASGTADHGGPAVRGAGWRSRVGAVRLTRRRRSQSRAQNCRLLHNWR